MRVLVTGGAGFIGSHLIEALLRAGHNVTVLDNLSNGLVANLPVRAPLIRRNVEEDLGAAFADVTPEVVIHLAAQISVPQSVQDPLRDLRVNAFGTANVMTAAARTGVRKVIMFSTAAVYGEPTSLPITESTPTDPRSPYGLSKLAGEEYVRLLARQYGLCYTIIRPANVFGPRQTTTGEGAVIPSFIQSFLAGRSPTIHGDGSQTRDFIYVTDVARAVVAALSNGDNMTVNISSGVGLTISAVWDHLAALLSWARPPVHGATRDGDIHDSILANGLASSVLDWRPQVSVAEGLVSTVSWALRSQAAVAHEQA